MAAYDRGPRQRAQNDEFDAPDKRFKPSSGDENMCRARGRRGSGHVGMIDVENHSRPAGRPIRSILRQRLGATANFCDQLPSLPRPPC